MAFEVRRCSAVASSALAQDWVGRIRAGDEAAFNSASVGVTRNVVRWAGRSLTYALPAGSVATLTWQ